MLFALKNNINIFKKNKMNYSCYNDMTPDQFMLLH